MLITDMISMNEVFNGNLKRVEVEHLSIDDLKSIELEQDIKNPTLLTILTSQLGKPMPQGFFKPDTSEFIYASFMLNLEQSFDVKDAVKIKKIKLVK